MKLRDYQQYCKDWLHQRPKAALWADMGTGKTATTIKLIEDLFCEFSTGRVLIIAPKRVCEMTWPQELQQWLSVDLSVAHLYGCEKQERERRTKQLTDITIINRELVLALTDHWGKRWPYDTVVIDESSSFKSASSKRFKTLRKTIPMTDRMIQLTGTPTSTSLLDLWSQVYLLDQGQRLGKTMGAYKRRWFEADYMGYNWTPKEGAEEEIFALLGDICLHLDTADCNLDLPERTINEVYVQLPPAARRAYQQLERDYLLEYERGDVVASSAGVLSGKLAQAANGAVYNEHKDVEYLHTAKIEALQEIVDRHPGQPILLAYEYQHDLAAIKQAFPHVVTIDVPDAVNRWNAGQIQMLACHPASAGHGLNLQFGGWVSVWYSITWSLELFQQFNKRLHRSGQKHNVIVHLLLAKDTVDETKLLNIENNGLTQRQLLDAVKANIDGESRERR